ncbi:hypothetical protein GMRT_15631 [Giardia muris]|uniref:Coiled-coil protein n=1 Tax=Giardia muris TaxID=5742 RepID=A0A4Z1SZ63_GIAMU|nr:hypothetical protein GMRT_15631 [Giardia muris]|eukprot:TNJ28778.1 hypothetical protein GMRT_15631 [Giardia muris]
MSGEVPLSQRIEARLQRQRSGYSASSALTTSTLALPSTAGSAISGAPLGPSFTPGALEPSLPVIRSMQNNLDLATQESAARAREMGQMRTRALALERENQQRATELKNKDLALRRTISEATGERQALVEALNDARANARMLREDADRREELIGRLEARITRVNEDLTQTAKKLSSVELDLQNERLSRQDADREAILFKERAEALEREVQNLKKLNEDQKHEVEELRSRAARARHLEQDLETLRERYREENEQWLTTKTELQQARGDLGLLDSKLKAVENDYNEVRKRMDAYRAAEDEASQARRRLRTLSDENEQLAHSKQFLEQHLANEREAGIAISNYARCVVGGEDPTQAATDLDRYRETSLYASFSTVLAKLRSECNKVRTLEEELARAEKNISGLRKENLDLVDARELLQTEYARLETTIGRNNASYDALAKDLDELKQQRDRLSQELERARVEAGSAMQILGGCLSSARRFSSATANSLLQTGALNATVGASALGRSLGVSTTGSLLAPGANGERPGSLSDAASHVATLVTRLQQEVQTLNRESDEIGAKLAQLEVQNRELANTTNDHVQELESGKRRLLEQNSRLLQLEGEHGTLSTSLIVVSQALLCALREIEADQERIKRLHCDKELAAVLFGKLAQECSATRDVIARYSDAGEMRSTGRAARKLRVATIALIFSQRLAKRGVEHRAFRDRTEERYLTLLQAGMTGTPANITMGMGMTLGASSLAGGEAAAPPPILELSQRFCQALQNQVRMLSDYRYGGIGTSSPDDRVRAIMRLLEVVNTQSDPAVVGYADLRYVALVQQPRLGVFQLRPATLADAALETCKSLVKRNDGLYNGLAEKEAYVAQVQSDNEALRAKVGDLNAQLLDLGTRLANVQSEMKHGYVSVEEHDAISKERDQLGFRVQNTEYQIQELGRDNEQLRADLLRYQRELERSAEGAKQYELEIGELNARIQGLTETVAQYKAMSATYEGQLSDGDRRKQDMDNMIAFLNGEIEKQQHKITELMGDLGRQHEELVARDEIIGRLSLQVEEEMKARKAMEGRLILDTEERKRKAEGRLGLTVDDGLLGGTTGGRPPIPTPHAPLSTVSTLTTGALGGFGASGSLPSYGDTRAPGSLAKDDIKSLIAQLDKSLGIIE